MPSTGTPSSNTTGCARGGVSSVTDSGPPERMIPRGAKARISSPLISQGCSSQYTPASRTRRAMSWEYWAPKSRMRMRCAWMSAGTALLLRSGGMRPSVRGATRLLRAVIRRLFDDGDVVHVALAHAGPCDANELRARAHLLDRAAPGVAHRRTQPACELVDDGTDRALVGHASLDALRDELLDLVGGVLEIAVARTVARGHRAERSHAAIALVRAALVQLDLSRRLLGAGEEAADHDGVRPGRDGFREIARVADAAVGDE